FGKFDSLRVPLTRRSPGDASHRPERRPLPASGARGPNSRVVRFNRKPSRGFCPTGKSATVRPVALSSPSRKNISVFPKAKSLLYLPPSRPHPEGRFAIVTDVGNGMRWTQAARLTSALPCGRRSRVVLTPRRWRQVLEKQSFFGMTVANKPGHRGEREGNR